MPDRNIMYTARRVHERRLELFNEKNGTPLVYDYPEALRVANGLNQELNPQESMWHVYQLTRIPIPEEYKEQMIKQGIPVPTD